MSLHFAQEFPPSGDVDDSGRVASQQRFPLSAVLAIVRKTNRSQLQLLVRRSITPAWPAPQTGYDHFYGPRNLVEIAVAAELIALGFVGQRLTRNFPFIIQAIFDPQNTAEAEYLVLLPHNDGPMPLPQLVRRDELENTVGIWPAVYVLNVRRIFEALKIAIADYTAKMEAN